MQQTTGHTVKLAWADQGYTGEQAKSDAADNGIELQVVKLPEAKKGFVLLPWRSVVERSFGWLARFRRLSRDFVRMPAVLAGLHFVVFAMLMRPKAANTGSRPFYCFSLRVLSRWRSSRPLVYAERF